MIYSKLMEYFRCSCQLLYQRGRMGMETNFCGTGVGGIKVLRKWVKMKVKLDVDE